MQLQHAREVERLRMENEAQQQEQLNALMEARRHAEAMAEARIQQERAAAEQGLQGAAHQARESLEHRASTWLQ